MSGWGKIDQENNAPKFVVDASTGESGIDEFGTEVFGVDDTEQSVHPGGIASPGWVRVIEGTGQLLTIEVTGGDNAYSNSDTLEIVATSGANAAANVVTDEDGVPTGAEITDFGGLFTESPTINVTTAAGDGAMFSADVGGRAGRKTYETLVCISSMTGDDEDTEFPDS